MGRTMNKFVLLVSALVHFTHVLDAAPVRSDFDFDTSSDTNAVQVDLSTLDEAGLSQASPGERSATLKAINNIVSKILTSSTEQLNQQKQADRTAKMNLDRLVGEQEKQQRAFEIQQKEHSGAAKLLNDTSKALLELQAAQKVIQDSKSNEFVYRSAQDLALRAQKTFVQKMQALLRVTEKTTVQDAQNYGKHDHKPDADPLGALSDSSLGSSQPVPLKSAEDVWPMVSALEKQIQGRMQELNKQGLTSEEKLIKIGSLIAKTEAGMAALQTDVQKQASILTELQKRLQAAQGRATEAKRLYLVTHAEYTRRAALMHKQIRVMTQLQNSTKVQSL